MEERLGRELAMAAKAARAHFDQALVGIGSSFQTYLVLRHVDRNRGVPQRELARLLGIENSTLTHHLDRLEAGGLVERVRSRDDRRMSATVLTTTGRAHLRKTGKLAEQMDAEFRDLFSGDELQTLRDCLRRIVDKYGEGRW
jgi:DNA-binding MarR family transcriptional regulator